MGFRWRHRRGSADGPVGPATRLSEWPAGAEGVITGVDGSSVLAARLLELGVTPGQPVRLLRAGCPMVLQVGQGRLCLRRRDADAVCVQLTCPAALL